MRGDQDSPFKSQGFAKGFLPQAHGIRVGNRGKSVIKNDLLEFHDIILISDCCVTVLKGEGASGQQDDGNGKKNAIFRPIRRNGRGESHVME